MSADFIPDLIKKMQIIDELVCEYEKIPEHAREEIEKGGLPTSEVYNVFKNYSKNLYLNFLINVYINVSIRDEDDLQAEASTRLKQEGIINEAVSYNTSSFSLALIMRQDESDGLSEILEAYNGKSETEVVLHLFDLYSSPDVKPEKKRLIKNLVDRIIHFMLKSEYDSKGLNEIFLLLEKIKYFNFDYKKISSNIFNYINCCTKYEREIGMPGIDVQICLN